MLSTKNQNTAAPAKPSVDPVEVVAAKAATVLLCNLLDRGTPFETAAIASAYVMPELRQFAAGKISKVAAVLVDLDNVTASPGLFESLDAAREYAAGLSCHHALFSISELMAQLADLVRMSPNDLLRTVN